MNKSKSELSWSNLKTKLQNINKGYWRVQCWYKWNQLKESYSKDKLKLFKIKQMKKVVQKVKHDDQEISLQIRKIRFHPEIVQVHASNTIPDKSLLFLTGYNNDLPFLSNKDKKDYEINSKIFNKIPFIAMNKQSRNALPHKFNQLIKESIALNEASTHISLLNTSLVKAKIRNMKSRKTSMTKTGNDKGLFKNRLNWSKNSLRLSTNNSTLKKSENNTFRKSILKEILRKKGIHISEKDKNQSV